MKSTKDKNWKKVNRNTLSKFLASRARPFYMSGGTYKKPVDMATQG